MKDYGVFKVIERIVREDDVLSVKGLAVVTEVSDELCPPYIKLTFGQVREDMPFAVRSALVTCDVFVVSDYPGAKESHVIMQRLNTLLDGAVERVGLNGTATFKLVEHKIVQKENRIGQITYQVKIDLEYED